jgi:hypothetical protein
MVLAKKAKTSPMAIIALNLPPLGGSALGGRYFLIYLKRYTISLDYANLKPFSLELGKSLDFFRGFF